MTTYLEDGHYSISNNLSENAIRPVNVVHQNWLFCDSTDGTGAGMMVYSLLEAAKANGLNPYKYLEYHLAARPNTSMPDEELDALAPWSEASQACCKNKSEETNCILGYFSPGFLFGRHLVILRLLLIVKYMPYFLLANPDIKADNNFHN